MSSLLATASEWKPDNETKPKKRTPTIGGGLQKAKAKKQNDIDELQIDESEPSSNQVGHYSIEDTQQYNDSRSARVTELLTNLTQIAAENDGEKLVNFNPVPRAALMARAAGIHPAATDAVTSKPPSEGFYSPQNPLQQPVPTVNRNYSGIAPMPNVGYLPGNSKDGNYTSYHGQQQNAPYYAKMGLGKSDDKLMEKINYMIHLLEEQQLEKTNNVMEEFILYSLLGVFMIYVMDSFVRVGKYTR
jgi:hypothetical protein